MKRRFLSLVLTLALCMGLVPACLAAGATFRDVPEGHWAHNDVEAAAEAGIMKGTGDGLFSPDMKVSAAQFLTLVGRVVFPDVQADGANWYGPYVTACQSAGLLTGTQVDTGRVEAEISRYDMAVILRAAAKQLGVTEKTAQQSEVTDYGMIPNMYTDAVLAVYGMGLIRGDEAGNFNGANTMMRSEVATVVMRLKRAAPGDSHGTGKPVETEPPITEIPADSEEDPLVTYYVTAWVQKTDHAIGRPVDDQHTFLPDVPLKLYYTPDGGKTSILIADVTSPPKDQGWDTVFTIEVPKSWSEWQNFQAGNGFYFSAETSLDGQRLVTSDLRTDGRAYKNIIRLTPGDGMFEKNFCEVELTPPDGEKARFTVEGYIEGYRLPDGSMTSLPQHYSGFTIQVYYKDGTLLGEAVSDSNGNFAVDCAVDALDGGFDKSQKLYYTKASGNVGSIPFREEVLYPADGSPFLKSLVDLFIIDDIGNPPLRPLRILVDITEELDAQQEAYNNK